MPSTRPSTTALPGVSSALAWACSSGVSGADAVSAVAGGGFEVAATTACAVAPTMNNRESSTAATSTRKPATSTRRARSGVSGGRGVAISLQVSSESDPTS